MNDAGMLEPRGCNEMRSRVNDMISVTQTMAYTRQSMRPSMPLPCEMSHAFGPFSGVIALDAEP
jgi:hypothetical protein